jgi:bifunctional UDP-N-acetylglucosamine pyrophosphorylase/glucosamine-1-phosphate N-acetyltransferase
MYDDGELMTNKNNIKNDAEKIAAIILAAGKGTRMASPLPKVLHPVAGLPMIQKVIGACRKAGALDIRLVVGHNSNLVKTVVQPFNVNCFEQIQQLGTADAVRAADVNSLEGLVLIVNGDHPLIQAEDLTKIITEFKDSKAEISVVTTEVKIPGSFGRIVRDHGKLHSIVEAKDASHETLKIKEINTGLYIVKAEALQDLLPKVESNNAQKEFYLTDIISIGIEQGYKVTAIKGASHVAMGVNTQAELAKASQWVFRNKVKKLMESGVMVLDPKTTYIEEDVQIGPASVIYPSVYVRGNTSIGSFCVLEPHSYVFESKIGDSVQIKAGTYIEHCRLHNHVSVGPYARLRPETEIFDNAHVGNFVEMKKVKFGKGSKAGHLTYLGDAEIGEEVNIGCGTITCNYAPDRKKYKTKIGNKVFVGSDTQFIAPIVIGDEAVIGSGSTITKDVPAKALAVARGKQFIKENYVKAEEVIEQSTEETNK